MLGDKMCASEQSAESWVSQSMLRIIEVEDTVHKSRSRKIGIFYYPFELAHFVILKNLPSRMTELICSF